MSAVTKIAKPKMRNLLLGEIKVNLGIIAVVSTTVAVCHRIFVCEARKTRYAEFKRTYDPEAAFERLKKRGVFDSCQ